MPDPERPAGPRRKRLGLAEEAAERVVAVLQRERSELVADPATKRELSGQVKAIVTNTLRSYAGATTGPLAPPSSAAIGDRRAAASIHPNASLRAATVLFEEVLPLLVRDGGQPNSDPVRLALVLHDVIGATILTAATTYVDNLMERLTTVHLQERRTLSAQLHDRVAQDIAAAARSLRMEPVPIDLVERILANALDDTRSMALELRQLVGDRRLDEALSSYLADLPAGPCPVTMVQEGVPRLLPALHQEEAFLIVREAIRNARKHAEASMIAVTLRWGEPVVSLVVTDDGRGFDPASTDRARMGLLVSRERADAINATLGIAAAPGRGTTVTLELQP